MSEEKENLLSNYLQYDYLNLDKERPTVKIFVSYIKPDFLFKSDILVPIHLGREIETDCSKSGGITKEDILWLHENCIGDNGFDGNISSLNRRVGFLTGTYYAFKNYEKIGNPLYFGSCGYRKLFNPECFNNLQDYDLILPEMNEVKPSILGFLSRLHGSWLSRAMLDCIKDLHSELYNEALQYFEGNLSFSHEMYIAKKDLFFDYCEWIFPALDYLLRIDFNKYEKTFEDKTNHTLIEFEAKGEKRDIAFIVERLTGFYFYHIINNYQIKYKTYPIVSFVPPYVEPDRKELLLKVLRNRALNSAKK